MIDFAPQFDYQTPFLLNSLLESEHKSRRLGVGSDFYRNSHFLSDPNPARIDITSSFTDPYESLYVKSFRQRSKLKVLTIIDGSDSLSVAKQSALITEYEQSIAQSVAAKNDQYACYLISDTLRLLEDSEAIQQHFAKPKPASAKQFDTAQALDKLVRVIPNQPSLTFVISDFHWSEQRLNDTFRQLAGHYVVPVVLWRSDHDTAYPLWRFIDVQDAETGRNRLIFVTPKQKQKICQESEQRKQYLQQFFQQYYHRAIWVNEQFNIDDLRAYFHGA